LHVSFSAPNFTASTLFVDSGFIPPDTMAAVGPDHIVELINGRYAVYHKSDGVRVQTSSLDQFWTAAGVSFQGFTFDPRILYDAMSQRWFAASVDNEGGDNHFLVAVSQSTDPTAGWLGLAIDSDSTHLRWADYPTLGLDRDGVYLAANMFPIAGRGGDFRVTIVAIAKADLLAATTPMTVVKVVGNTPTDPGAYSPPDPSVPENLLIATPTGTLGAEPAPSAMALSGVQVTIFENLADVNTGIAVQPVVNLDNQGLPAALLSNFNTAGVEFKRSNISGTITAPMLDTSDGLIDVPLFNAIFSAKQPSPAQNLEILNGAIFHANVVRRHGAFWGVHTVNNGGRAALHWFQIDADRNVLLQDGLIADPTLDFYYGSIAVNDVDDVVIGFSGSGESQFVSSYVVHGQTVAGVTTFEEPLLLQAGVATYVVTFGAGRNRWGDYSTTVVDPMDPLTFWTVQEWVSAENIWSTQITQLKLQLPPHRCPLGQGFWKNHPEAWPVSSLTLGSQTYSQTELLTLLNTPVRGDASLILADQLIAAKLNLANGADPTPISATIADADRLLSGFTGKLPYHVPPSSATGQAMVDDATVLESYNNGELTPECTP
jgi:hypothetical protein